MKTELLKTVRRYPGEFYIGQGRGAWVHIWSKPREIIPEARKSLKKRQRRFRKYRAPRRAYYVGVLMRIRRGRRGCVVFSVATLRRIVGIRNRAASYLVPHSGGWLPVR